MYHVQLAAAVVAAIFGLRMMGRPFLTPQQLRAAFNRKEKPMDWRDAKISAGVGPGWESLVDELHEHVLSLDPEIVIDQVKEKFGGLRYYVTVSDDGPESAVYALIGEYEKRAFKTCEWCGATEGVETSAGEKKRWLKTLCPTHRAEWDAERRWWTYDA